MDTVSSKAAALLLLIHCLMFVPLFVGVLGWSLICCAFLSVRFSFAFILTWKKERESWLLYLNCLSIVCDC